MVHDDLSSIRRTITTDIVAAYVSNNVVGANELPLLIRRVYESVLLLEAPSSASAKPAEAAVSAKKSITPDFLISLEDGRPYKSLKRHLTRYGLTPQQYRRKWGLPYDYPMVAPNYAKRRSDLARQIGLGSQARRSRASSDPEGTGGSRRPPRNPR